MTSTLTRRRSWSHRPSGQRSEVAAQGFAVSFEEALRKISSDPERFPRVDRRHQACNLETYPFQVIYRQDGQRIWIIAIAHAKRRPNYWQRRSRDSP